MSGTGKRESNFVVQGSILAVAGIIVRLIGILYRVPMTNIIGDEGMGYYSTAFNVYNIMLILSSYSLPVAVSRMISAKLARREYRNAYRVLTVALIYATVAGGLGCAITWAGGNFFAASLFDTPLAVYALKTLAPTIWIMAYLGVLRGFFQGHGTMIPTAVSQILEQVINAIISVTAASVLFRMGTASGTAGMNAALGAAGGTIGTGAGALTAFVFVLGLLILYRPVMGRRLRRDRKKRPDSYGETGQLLLFTVVPVIVSSAIYNINAVIDNGIMAHGMDFVGQGERFLKLWGIYNNKYMLLVHVPLAMANSLSSSLIPSLSAASARKDEADMLAKTGLVIRFAMLIAIPAAVGLTVLAEPAMNLLFHGASNTEAIRMMTMGAAAVIFLSLSTVSNAILQGLGHMNEPVRNAFISLVLHILVLLALLLGFRMGIYAMIFANIFFAVSMCVLNQLSIRRYLPYDQEIRKTFLLPLAASGLMGAGAWLVYHGLYALLPLNALCFAAAVAAAVALYGILLIALRALTPEELNHIPGGTRLASLAERLRR